MLAPLRKFVFGTLALAGLALALTTLAPDAAVAGPCPGFSAGFQLTTSPFPAGCSTDISLTGQTFSTLSVNIQSDAGPYDNSGNVIVGVTNNSSVAVYDLFVYGFNNNGSIFNIPTGTQTLCQTSLGLACAAGGTGDEGVTSAGQTVYFTTMTGEIINASNAGVGAPNEGDVIFGPGGLLPGQTAYFALGQDVASAVPSPFPTPEPSAFLVLGTALLGFALMRRRQLI